VVEERPENLTNPMTVKCFWDNLEPHKFPLEERDVPAVLRAQKILKIAMHNNTACVVHQSLDDAALPRKLTCWDVYQDPLKARVATREIPPSHLAENAPLTQFYVLDAEKFLCVLVFCDSDLLIGGSTGRHFTAEQMQENIDIPKAIAVQYLSATHSIEDRLNETPSSFSQVLLPDFRSYPFNLNLPLQDVIFCSYLTDDSNNLQGIFYSELWPSTQGQDSTVIQYANTIDIIGFLNTPIKSFLGGLGVAVFIGQTIQSSENSGICSLPITTIKTPFSVIPSRVSIQVPSDYADEILCSLHERIHGFTLFIKKSLTAQKTSADLLHFVTRPRACDPSQQAHLLAAFPMQPITPKLITTQVDNLKFFSSTSSTPRTYTLKPSGQLVLSDFDVEILQTIQQKFCNTWSLDQNAPILIGLKNKGEELYGKIFKGTLQRVIPSIYRKKCHQTLLKTGIKEVPSDESLKLYKNTPILTKTQKAKPKSTAGRISSFITYIFQKSVQVIQNFFSHLVGNFRQQDQREKLIKEGDDILNKINSRVQP
jgi:hypothetical protein